MLTWKVLLQVIRPLDWKKGFGLLIFVTNSSHPWCDTHIWYNLAFMELITENWVGVWVWCWGARAGVWRGGGERGNLYIRVCHFQS